MQLETGLGKTIAIKPIEVTWQCPNSKQLFTDIPINEFVKLTEGEPAFEKLTFNTYKLNTNMPSHSTILHLTIFKYIFETVNKIHLQNI
jgi:hypothetical protein